MTEHKKKKQETLKKIKRLKRDARERSHILDVLHKKDEAIEEDDEA